MAILKADTLYKLNSNQIRVSKKTLYKLNLSATLTCKNYIGMRRIFIQTLFYQD